MFDYSCHPFRRGRKESIKHRSCRSLQHEIRVQRDNQAPHLRYKVTSITHWCQGRPNDSRLLFLAEVPWVRTYPKHLVIFFSHSLLSCGLDRPRLRTRLTPCVRALRSGLIYDASWEGGKHAPRGRKSQASVANDIDFSLRGLLPDRNVLTFFLSA